jgi:hypothetical protein
MVPLTGQMFSFLWENELKRQLRIGVLYITE